MTRKGFEFAINYAHGLPVFESASAATVFLTQQKEETLSSLRDELGASLELDFTPESLKRLERWYCQAAFPERGVAGYSMPHALGFYFGEVLCQHAKFQWIVAENELLESRFEIGVQRGLGTIMLMRGRKPVLDGNARMQSLWREYQKFAKLLDH